VLLCFEDPGQVFDHRAGLAQLGFADFAAYSICPLAPRTLNGQQGLPPERGDPDELRSLVGRIEGILGEPVVLQKIRHPSSGRLDYENMHGSSWGRQPGKTPTGVAVFAEDVAIRRYSAYGNNIVHWSEFDTGATSPPWILQTSS
jgi:hypothetical protein